MILKQFEDFSDLQALVLKKDLQTDKNVLSEHDGKQDSEDAEICFENDNLKVLLICRICVIALM